MSNAFGPLLAKLHADPQVHVDADQGDLADLMQRCAHRDQRNTRFRRRLHARLAFMRHHLVTLLVGGALITAALVLLV